MKTRELTAETLQQFREYFRYEPDTGVLRWRRSPSDAIKEGYIAGRRHTNGHLEVGLKNRVYMAHHIVWVLAHGGLPKKTLMHVNGNKRDNRLENLVESGYGPTGIGRPASRGRVK